jgi:hypothetical protein
MHNIIMDNNILAALLVETSTDIHTQRLEDWKGERKRE